VWWIKALRCKDYRSSSGWHEAPVLRTTKEGFAEASRAQRKLFLMEKVIIQEDILMFTGLQNAPALSMT